MLIRDVLIPGWGRLDRSPFLLRRHPPVLRLGAARPAGDVAGAPRRTASTNGRASGPEPDGWAGQWCSPGRAVGAVRAFPHRPPSSARRRFERRTEPRPQRPRRGSRSPNADPAARVRRRAERAPRDAAGSAGRGCIGCIPRDKSEEASGRGEAHEKSPDPAPDRATEVRGRSR